MKCLSKASVGFWLFLTLSCQTVKDPGQSRESYPVSIGSGIVYTPKKSTGIGVMFDIDSFIRPNKVAIRSGAKGLNAYSINSEATDKDLRQITSKAMAVDMMAMYFPWDKSSFFTGIVGRAKSARNAYSEWVGDVETSRSTTNIEWEDQSLTAGPLVGLNLRYENMGAVTFGVALGKTVWTKRSFLDNGDSDNVNQSLRSSTLSSYDDYRNSTQLMYVGMYSYSFKP